MKKLFIIVIIAATGFPAMALTSPGGAGQDTAEIIKLNNQGFASRLTNPQQTVSCASRAMALAKSAGYKDGMGEAYRVLGIGYYYLNRTKDAIDSYLAALIILHRQMIYAEKGTFTTILAIYIATTITKRHLNI